MGIALPQICFSKVMHGRLFPRVNKFTYGIYYMALPLSRITDMVLPYNRFGWLSFYDKDHGACDGSGLEQWARKILNDHNIKQADGEIVLMCMPRVMGYVFNPVSFWLCHDRHGGLRAVLCEVHNTFGERHTYICVHDNARVIDKDDVLKGEKLFHVSPFLPREGGYDFRFDVTDGSFGVWIDYYSAEGKKQLVTWLRGDYIEMNKASLRRAFWTYPMVTFKAVYLIHWQALKLIAKGIKYIHRPKQNKKTQSIVNVLKDNDSTKKKG